MRVKKLKRAILPTVRKYIALPLVEIAYYRQLVPRMKNYPRLKPEAKTLNSILQINTISKQGGAARIAYLLNQALASRGFNSQMLVGAASSDEDMEVLPNNASLMQKLLYIGQIEKGWLDFFHLSSLKIKDLDAFKNADLVHLHNLHGGYFSIFALPEITALKPTVWTLHDMQPITGHCAHSFDCDRWLTGCGSCPDIGIYPGIKKDTTEFLWQTKKSIYNYSDLTIVCPSQWLKEKVERSILKDKDIRLIYNGVDQSIFTKSDKAEARIILGLPLDKKIILFSAYAGVDNPWKGGQFLTHIYRNLNSRGDILFLNVGGSEAGFKGNNWLNVPYITDEKTMANYYSASDLLIYPSLADNCPLVVLEALSCGVPVIAFQTGGIPELINHMETGYLAKYKDIEDLVKGVRMFIDNPDLISKVSINAFESSKMYSLERMADEYIKLYTEFFISK